MRLLTTSMVLMGNDSTILGCTRCNGIKYRGRKCKVGSRRPRNFKDMPHLVLHYSSRRGYRQENAHPKRRCAPSTRVKPLVANPESSRLRHFDARQKGSEKYNKNRPPTWFATNHDLRVRDVGNGCKSKGKEWNGVEKGQARNRSSMPVVCGHCWLDHVTPSS